MRRVPSRGRQDPSVGRAGGLWDPYGDTASGAQGYPIGHVACYCPDFRGPLHMKHLVIKENVRPDLLKHGALGCPCQKESLIDLQTPRAQRPALPAATVVDTNVLPPDSPALPASPTEAEQPQPSCLYSGIG
ncbi:hypothetical protein NQZ68_023840 [Dissostichus eleginoides]|nr:hypothetical protein NQZ68_023840 [Dissostichus eleginoides]